MTQWNRRKFLVGAGALMGLPLLEELVGAKAYGEALKQYNYFTCFYAMGCPRQFVRPDLSTTPLKTLQPLIEAGKGSILTGLQMPKWARLSAGGSIHHGSAQYVASGYPIISGDKVGGMTLDYRMYQNIKNRKATLQDLFSAGVFVGRAARVSKMRSWRSSKNGVPAHLHPKDSFHALFGKGQKNSDGSDQLVIDAVLGQYRSLMGERSALSANTKQEIQRSFEQVEAIEKGRSCLDSLV